MAATAQQEAELLYRVKVEARQAISDMQAVSGTIKNFQNEAANAATKTGSLQRNMQNMGYQLQDFVVQTTNGTDALKAFGQQAPQMLMGFGAIGSILGVVIALAPAVVSAIKAMGDSSVQAANDLKRWTDEMENLAKMGKEIESFAKAVTSTAADGFKAYVEEYNKASKVQRAEMEAWLKLKLEVEKAKLNDMTSEQQGRNIDWGASSGMPSGETQNFTPSKQRLVELGSEIRVQTDNVKRLTAAVNGDFKTAVEGATVKAAKHAGDKVDSFERVISSAKAKQAELLQNQNLLNSASADGAQILKAVTESEKQKLKVQEDINNNVVKYTELQKKKLFNILDENIAIDKNNVLQTEANKIILSSRTALDVYNDEIAKATTLLEAKRLTVDQYNVAIGKAKKTLADADPLVSGVGSAVNSAFMDAAFSGKQFTNVLGDMAIAIAKVGYQVVVVEPLVRALKDSMVSMGWVSTRVGPSFSSTPVESIQAPAGTPFFSANGNVFDAPVSSGVSNVIPFAKGGVVNSSKYFPMSGGKTGVMGEAGAEAIIPLKRDSQGKLGVSGAVGGSATQVNIYNETGGDVQTKERKNSDGSSVIDVYIKKAVADGIASGQFDKPMAAAYGMRRVGSR